MFGFTRSVEEMEEALVAKEAQIAELRCEQVVLVNDLRRARAVDAVAHRDGACTIDGCSSRYRLEPHHIRPWSRGGDHAVDNIATLCWYHHHVAIHGDGYEIDRDSSPQRRTLRKSHTESRAGPY